MVRRSEISGQFLARVVGCWLGSGCGIRGWIGSTRAVP